MEIGNIDTHNTHIYLHDRSLSWNGKTKTHRG